MNRANKPSTLSATPGPEPQAQVTVSSDNSRVAAQLPTGESIDVLLHGATVLSWKDAAGDEKLWLSDAAKLDGSGPARGGIPLVFPVFGTSDHPPVAKLPQHGFARNSRWEFLGKSTSEGATSGVKLDFGLSSDNVDETIQALWPYKYTLLYSVTLEPKNLVTTLVISNDGETSFEFQTLLHTYFKVNNIEDVQVTGLEDASYIDKVDGLKTKAQSGAVTFAGETDRIYTPAIPPSEPLVITEAGKPKFSIVRQNLENAVVFNPWVEKAKATADLEPKDAWKNLVCVEPGTVGGWHQLDKGDTFEVAQTISLP
ncbi:unnamed protein product [Clonostachys rosea f. rosea IK726]|uniref:Glucose-6-phosphate 1-epimerase n=2 Tax=Bionectria ochroleuca TaxID=29856 RepID=A0A0B7JYB7_BIOOC|nr:unnamed protein product [Clonostachys rosea f. rosea IK726]